MNAIDIEKHQREDARWRILRILDVGRPYPLTEQLILRALGDAKLPVTLQGLRREMDYLSDKGLIEIEGRETDAWSASLTGTGVDVVEYTIPSPPGISRPPRS